MSDTEADIPQRPERIWLLRHAETATPTVFHGAESDIGLSELGFRQAEVGAEWFRPLKPTLVISSAMTRAISTASPIARLCQTPHLVETDLHERQVGALCGTSFSLAQGPWAETVAKWSAGETSYTTPGAESYDDLSTRLLTAWNRILSSQTTGRIVIVAHGVVCKVLLLSLLQGWGPRGWVELGRVANYAVSELVPTPQGWHAQTLLTVPPPVAALSDGRPTGVGIPPLKSEA